MSTNNLDHRDLPNGLGVHFRHCYQDEYETTCKYGDKDCPAHPVLKKGFVSPRHPLDTLNVFDLSTLRLIIENVLRDYQTVSLSDEGVRRGLVEVVVTRVIAAAAPNVKGATTHDSTNPKSLKL